jgi:hypothetical protein
MCIQSVKCPHCKGIVNLSQNVKVVSAIDVIDAKKAFAAVRKIPVIRKKYYVGHPIRPITNTDRRIIKFHDRRGWVRKMTPQRLADRLGIGLMQVAGVVAYMHRGKKK